jgi:cytochrome P450
VYLANPADIKTVFTGDPAVFHAGEGNHVLEPVMGRHSVLLLDEDEHLRQRKRLLPPFHGEAVRRYGEVIAGIAEDAMARWPVGRPYPLHPSMQAITLEAIIRAVIGAEDPARQRALREVLGRVANVSFVISLMWVHPGLGRIGPWRRYNRVLRTADELLYEEIRARRRDPRLAERNDVLSLLIRDGDLSDAELRDHLVTLLLAGHETTATGLGWAFERLARHPAALRRLQDGDDAYLDAVVRETLRVRPVIFDVARRLTSPVVLGGHRLPAGVTILPSIGLVQRDGARWPDPLAFRPERFLEDDAPGYAWIPFGGGRRRCLGAAFAMFEMKVVLRAVLSRFDIAPDRWRDERVKARHITLIPGRGARVVLSAR